MKDICKEQKEHGNMIEIKGKSKNCEKIEFL